MSQNPLQEVELYAFASNSAQFYLDRKSVV